LSSQDPAFLDTSYVVRYLTDSPPEMAAQATRIIDSDEPLLLSELVILETAFVLGSVYRVTREDIVDALIGLVQRRNILLPNLPKTRVLAALELCRPSKRYSFQDAFLWVQALEAGAGRRIYTFDRKFPAQGIALVGLQTEQPPQP
jgi:predicted nucleic acid-binding protein